MVSSLNPITKLGFHQNTEIKETFTLVSALENLAYELRRKGRRQEPLANVCNHEMLDFACSSSSYQSEGANFFMENQNSNVKSSDTIRHESKTGGNSPQHL